MVILKVVDVSLEDFRDIRCLSDAGVTGIMLADMYNVNDSLISKIINIIDGDICYDNECR